MLTVISPAKKLDETPKALPEGIEMTEPRFADRAMVLAKAARRLSVAELRKLSGISEPLARLNRDRFAAFSADPAPGTIFAAAQCFAGDTYQGLDLRTMTPEGLARAETHLRILSGLYGLLRPFDAIQAYRLEMGSKLNTRKGADLYAFWGDDIARALRADAGDVGAKAIVNCASVEYFTAADRPALGLPVITPVFLEEKDGERRTVSFWAKRARGAMARFICENALTQHDDLRAFASNGYVWQSALSSPDRPVFLRPQAVQDAA